ncbi:hypothetical protein LMG31886_42500 [Xanthomonas hydrangeae]|nr:hypothetical protein LMG31884_43550 [Xanthomonas hydrangeae]CAD7729467.1 hypothetical protein LMG31884_43550 [Xanthomonas hydrangeae]CAD7732402.1 hypothetical protein LMG31885_17890 [Xanthomonas hydrangeae]CAD7732405.1 hypothetical protein LMG31885_17890 [Xanthomonas hydrangeae]CAD7744856.1 hypothetical protein LMG31887_43470 [Xanthomonas hydrangeae]
MRVRAKPLALKLLRVASPRTLTPTPLPQGEGMQSAELYWPRKFAD